MLFCEVPPAIIGLALWKRLPRALHWLTLCYCSATLAQFANYALWAAGVNNFAVWHLYTLAEYAFFALMLSEWLRGKARILCRRSIVVYAAAWAGLKTVEHFTFVDKYSFPLSVFLLSAFAVLAAWERSQREPADYPALMVIGVLLVYYLITLAEYAAVADGAGSAWYVYSISNIISNLCMAAVLLWAAAPDAGAKLQKRIKQ